MTPRCTLTQFLFLANGGSAVSLFLQAPWRWPFGSTAQAPCAALHSIMTQALGPVLQCTKGANCLAEAAVLGYELWLFSQSSTGAHYSFLSPSATYAYFYSLCLPHVCFLGTSLQIKKCSAGMLTAEFPHYASPSFSGAASQFNIAECPWWGTEVAALAEDRLLTSLLTLFFLVFCKGRHSSSVASDCAGKHQGSETTAALWGVIKHLRPSHPREELMHTPRASLHQLIPPFQ